MSQPTEDSDTRAGSRPAQACLTHLSLGKSVSLSSSSMTICAVRTSQASPHTDNEHATWRQRIGALAAHIAAPLHGGSPANVQVSCSALSNNWKRWKR